MSNYLMDLKFHRNDHSCMKVVVMFTLSQLYMDGALSNNMPLSELRNTITMAPFAGESDVCPREGTFCPLQVNYGDLSIKVTTMNVQRICTSFLPPRLEVGTNYGQG